MKTAGNKSTLLNELAGILGVDESRVDAYVWALGIRETCSRCHGSGHHSRCWDYGTVCFRCHGRKATAAKITKSVVAQVKFRVETGELQALQAKWAAQRAAKLAIKPILEQAKAIYRIISDEYTAANRNPSMPLFHAQGMNNSLYWGHTADGWGAKIGGSICDIQNRTASGEDPIKLKSEAESVVVLLEVLVSEWKKFSDSP